MPDRPHSLLHHPDPALNEWFVLVSTSQIEAWRAGELVHELLEWSKFPVAGDGGNLKSTLQVVNEDSFESLKNLLSSSISQVGDCGETDVSTQRQKERNSVDEEYVD